ncbi:MAG TPA: ABC transporter permease [Polyangiaceae bacterium]|nr:ABC transporter permease [Polyangiaceae bacterium]
MPVRRALGRLLAWFATLAVTSLLALWALSALATPRPSEPSLPLFFNARPRNVYDLARSAIDQIVRGERSEEAARELARLGGAGLPHVLPDLDTLPPRVRGRVAFALNPIAERMGVARKAELATEEDAVVFWTRFWQDRSFDFRPQVSRRLVQRLARQSSSLREEDLAHLDTYCLVDVMQALGTVRSPEDVARAARLTEVLAHVTSQGQVVEPWMSVEQANGVVRRWRRFWADHGADFLTLSGPLRVAAMFSQTRYGRFVGRVVRAAKSESEVDLISERAGPHPITKSLLRLIAALAASVLISMLWVRLESGASGARRAGLRGAACVVLALPPWFIATGLGLGGPRFHPAELGPMVLARELGLLALGALLGGAILSRCMLGALSHAGDPREVVWRELSGVSLRALPSALPWLLGSQFCLEIAGDSTGLAKATLDALGRGQVTTGILVALGTTALSWLLLVLASWAPLLGGRTARPPALLEVDGPSRRRLLLASAALLGLLLALAGAGHTDVSRGLGLIEVCHGAEALLMLSVSTLVIAVVLGIAAGAAAASGPRLFDSLLLRSTEIASALPAFMWAAALALSLQSGFAFACALGVLRAIDIAWLLRSELVELAELDSELGLRSLGRLPIRAYVRERLRPAVLSALAGVALTPAWALGIAAAVRFLDLPPLSSRRAWDDLLSGAHAVMPGAWLFAAALLSLVSFLSLTAVASPSRRVGSLRSNPPPKLVSSPPPAGGAA